MKISSIESMHLNNALQKENCRKYIATVDHLKAYFLEPIAKGKVEKFYINQIRSDVVGVAEIATEFIDGDQLSKVLPGMEETEEYNCLVY